MQIVKRNYTVNIISTARSRRDLLKCDIILLRFLRVANQLTFLEGLEAVRTRDLVLDVGDLAYSSRRS